MKTIFALFLLSACAASAATEEKIVKTFATSPGNNLVVEVGFGSIEVVGSPDRAEVGVEVWRKITRSSASDEEQYLRDNPVEIAQAGNTVNVRSAARSKWSWFGSWRNRNEARYVVHVPASFNATLKTSGGTIAVSAISGSVIANTSGGSLNFANIHGRLDGHTSGGGIKVVGCEGEVRVGTSGGGIEVSEGGGALNGDTSGGSISVKSFNGSASVDTSGGGITLENIRGRIHGNTSGGSIHATLVTPLPGDVDLSTSGGNVQVDAAASASFLLDAKTLGGGVSSDLPVVVQGEVGRGQLKGTVNAGGPTVKLHSSGGSIRIRKS